MHYTAADLNTMPSEVPSGPIDYELMSGRLVVINFPFTAVHGAVTANVITQLSVQGRKQNGRSFARVGIVLRRNPDTVLAPDAAFIANKSLPVRESAEGFLKTIPELVVEVLDRNDSLKYVQRKVQHYLKAGVEIVWVADPTALKVTAHTPSGEPIVYNEGDTLRLPELIPGFSMIVSDVFLE